MWGHVAVMISLARVDRKRTGTMDNCGIVYPGMVGMCKLDTGREARTDGN